MGEMMRPEQVGELLGVNSKTVTRWAIAGKLRCLTLPGGHRRFYRSDIEQYIADNTTGGPNGRSATS